MSLINSVFEFHLIFKFFRSHTLNKLDKKKSFDTGTMKPMSAHDEKTLETAVALANEITTK